MALFVIRHTRTACAESICYGDLDVDVAESFEQEYLAIREDLPQIDIIHSSPLSRCYKLAERIGDDIGKTVKIEPRLAEMHFGDWQGKSWDNIPRQEIDNWAQNFAHYNGHGGESVVQLRSRVAEVLSLLPVSQNCLLVTHAGFIRSALYLSNRSNPCSGQESKQEHNHATEHEEIFVEDDERQLKIGYGEIIQLDSTRFF